MLAGAGVRPRVTNTSPRSRRIAAALVGPSQLSVLFRSACLRMAKSAIGVSAIIGLEIQAEKRAAAFPLAFRLRSGLRLGLGRGATRPFPLAL